MSELTAKEYLSGVKSSGDLFIDLNNGATAMRWLPEDYRMKYLGFSFFPLASGRCLWYPENGSRSKGFVGTDVYEK